MYTHKKRKHRSFLCMDVWHRFICHDKRVRELCTPRQLLRYIITEDALILLPLILPVHWMAENSKECF